MEARPGLPGRQGSGEATHQQLQLLNQRGHQEYRDDQRQDHEHRRPDVLSEISRCQGRGPGCGGGIQSGPDHLSS